MSALETFNEIRYHKLSCYICDDVYYYCILPHIKHEYCTICYAWIGSNKVKASFFKENALCFVCRHKCMWPENIC